MNYQFDWGAFFAPAMAGQTYFDWLLSGLKITVMLGLSAWVVALVVGSVLGIMRTLQNPWLTGVAAAYVEIFRNIPLLVQLFIWYFVFPELLPQTLGHAIKTAPPLVQQFIVAWLCLGLFTAARICEQVRSGLNSLPVGQKNAALAMGLTLAQTYRYVLIPRTFRVIFPPLTSEFLNIFKNSAVASTIGLLELAAQGRQLVDYMARPYESFIAVTLLYLLINVTVMAGMRWLEKRIRMPGYIGGK
ncbi:MAG: amino acid ABC transporter permease [Ottowia sp.]|nr:amino acid ABC transporter permease [Ottowia sp.]